MKKYVVLAADGVALFDSVPEWALNPKFLVVVVEPPEEKKEDDIDSWPIPTDEDARWRPKVMVRDTEDHSWLGSQTLVFVRRNGGESLPFMCSEGAKWRYCRISPEEKARCDFLNKKLDS